MAVHWGKIEELKNQIKNLEIELQAKDALIKDHQKKLAASNTAVLKITRQVEEDLKKLYSLYELLVPAQFPSIPNCEFSFKFISSSFGSGKDFYQVIPLKRMRFGLIMSSCSSHILSSLLFSSRVKLMSKMIYSQPSDLLKDLAKESTGRKNSLPVKPRVDIFYAVMNRKTYKLSYCLVGRVYGFIYLSSTKELVELKSSAGEFNTLSAEKFISRKKAFNPRDRLIICSPGLIEAVDKTGAVFGVERFKKVVLESTSPGVRLIRNNILYAVQSFTKGQKQSRDQSLIVMEIKNRILKLA